ncbi:hypothetical protein M378DRAFT_160150 [Amanita muscaria Koide BX008]|uniref:Uncharacterized protein n=1 Tax=Amanita muscaria (strain Koide BX008) TaxID=946122 RepID=A0A0C2TJH9_AMAMK|nr:hypothetical protein M378DRAFT_160150 [Amanita muscaria Koide BX008]
MNGRRPNALIVKFKDYDQLNINDAIRFIGGVEACMEPYEKVLEPVGMPLSARNLSPYKAPPPRSPLRLPSCGKSMLANGLAG